MGYDWAKIFSEKTSKELFDIINGKSMLSNEVIPFAKAELRKRNFDLNNKDTNIDNLVLEERIRDYKELQQRFKRKYYYVSAKNLFFILGVITIIAVIVQYLYLQSVTPFYFYTGLVLFYVVVIVNVTIGNRLYKKEEKRLAEIKNEIAEFTKKLKEGGKLTTDSFVFRDIEIENKRMRERKIILIIVIVLIFIIHFISKYINHIPK